MKDVFCAAIERREAERPAFLDSACDGDPELRAEVERLLLQGDATSLISPAAGVLNAAAERATHENLTLTAGFRLGPYEIVEPIGSGGMGEVWKARDIRLDRLVAIKTSKSQFSARFEREARAIAALNHPSICQIYDVGPNYLVMEYIEGVPLKGPLSIADALRLAVPIAESLDAAHRKGIVHRDLKPANIMVTKSGVKLLDFGLAKMHRPTASEDTFTLALTGERTILGTLHYMSPEQLQGRDADARSDIFAFGLVLYEMLTGRRAFEASGYASLLDAILHTEAPPVSGLVPATPPALERLIRQCLARDPDSRWQSAQDIASELRWIAEVGDTPVSVARSQWSRGRLASWIAISLLAVLAIAVIAGAFRHPRESPSPRPVVRFRLDLPAGATAFSAPAFSSDGAKIVLDVRSGSNSQLWIRSLDSPTLRPLPGTEGSRGQPIFSPDGRYLAFMSGWNLRRLDIATGVNTPLCELLTGNGVGPHAWGPDGVILITESGVIKRISDSGGARKAVTELAPGEYTHISASFLPDGHHFLYWVYTPGSRIGATLVGSIDDPKFRKQILQGTGPAHYTSPGWLLFSRGDVVLAQSFDVRTLELKGEPTPVAEQVASNSPSSLSYSASETGSLAWRLGSDSSMELVWFDRSGKRLATVGEPGEIANPVLSPDGKRVLITIRDPRTETRDIWILDLGHGTTSRLTSDPGEDYNPVWSPDGASFFFSSNRKGHRDIYRMRADGIGAQEELLVSNVEKSVDSVSPDAKYLLYNAAPAVGKQYSIWALPLLGERKPTFVAGDSYFASEGQVSPNGRWIAYVSRESGKDQVFVLTAPGSNLPAGKWQVSIAGGIMPQWRSDGKELFFFDGDKLMAAGVRSEGTSFDAGTQVRLFPARRGISRRNHFTASADGQRFLFASPRESATDGEVHVLLNWPALLKKN